MSTIRREEKRDAQERRKPAIDRIAKRIVSTMVDFGETYLEVAMLDYKLEKAFKKMMFMDYEMYTTSLLWWHDLEYKRRHDYHYFGIYRKFPIQTKLLENIKKYENKYNIEVPKRYYEDEALREGM
jgi:hypothetical protein